MQEERGREQGKKNHNIISYFLFLFLFSPFSTPSPHFPLVTTNRTGSPPRNKKTPYFFLLPFFSSNSGTYRYCAYIHAHIQSPQYDIDSGGKSLRVLTLVSAAILLLLFLLLLLFIIFFSLPFCARRSRGATVPCHAMSCHVMSHK